MPELSEMKLQNNGCRVFDVSAVRLCKKHKVKPLDFKFQELTSTKGDVFSGSMIVPDIFVIDFSEIFIRTSFYIF